MAYEGVDADLETSLEEYNFVMKPNTEDYPDEYYVIYKIDEGKYGHGYIREKDIDALMNGDDWADKESVDSCLSFVGLTKEEWLKIHPIHKFSDIVSCWGFENVMGTEYYPNSKAWAFEKIGIEESE